MQLSRPHFGLLPPALVMGSLALYGAVSTPALADRWGISPLGILTLLAWIGVAGLALPLYRTVLIRSVFPAIFAIAMALRLAFSVAVYHEIPAGDARSYLALASSFNHGTGLQVFEPYIGAVMRAFYPPLYPIILAGWTAVGGASYVSLFVLNACIDGLAVVLIYQLGAKLGRPGAGRSAAWLFAVWPSTLLSAALAQKEGLCVALIMALAISWLSVIDRERRRRDVVAVGLLGAALALTQPGLAPITGLIGLALAFIVGFRLVISFALRAIPITIVAMLPWWVRNWFVLDTFVALTTAGQISLWVGNHAGASGNWEPTPPIRPGMTEVTYGKALGAAARGWILTQPFDFARLTLAKFVRACGVAQFGLIRFDALVPRIPRAVDASLFAVSQSAHLFLLGLGSATAALRGIKVPPPLWALLGAGAAQLVLFGVWFEFGERHREFMTPFLLLAITCAFGPPEKSTRIASI